MLQKSSLPRLCRRPATIVRFLSALAVVGGLAASAEAQPVVITNLNQPEGIAADTTGAVYVQWDATFSGYVLSRLTSGGAVQASVPYGGITTGNDGHVARVPNTNTML